MNIIEVMRLPVGTKLNADFADRPLKIYEQDGVKVLKFDKDFRRLVLDNEVTEAVYSIIE